MDSKQGLTRREALQAGGMALAGVAGAAVLGSCTPETAQTTSAESAAADASTASSTDGSASNTASASNAPDASSAANERENLPVDNTGSGITEQDSMAEATHEPIEIDDPGVPIRYDMVDAHLHYCDFTERSDGFAELVRAQDMCGVSESVIFGLGIAKQWDEHAAKAPTYYLSDDSRCYYYSATDFLLAEDLLAQPESIQARFHPFCCGINSNDRFAADHIRQLLKIYPNFWAGIGELMSRHDDLTALTYGEPPHIDHPAFLDIFDLGAEEGLPVMVHHNITAQQHEEILYLDELKRAVAHNPACNIIWAHVGISRRVEIQNLPEIAADMLAAHPNLYTDISWVVYDYYFKDAFPDGYFDGNTMDDWAQLCEEYPDRIMIGTDKVGHWKTYPAEIVKYYDLLDRLEPETAQAICHDNILRLVKR
ncbi:MAG: amidohydrolase family protein [Eggerthellaceae bacterium]|nr:amidohydrolase family protein [Eggerthellaceae bacterium]